MEEKKKAAYRVGVIVLVVLFVLTIGEYFVAQIPGGVISVLFIIAIAKSWAIMKYFMHITSLWSEEGGH
ncbi:MAG: hypothetical protein D6768_13745 [Chloroflexi bacterium]|nr:MAG: hypothetical protein D6768_13745 [Chloroflexota bacterium]